MIPFAIRSVRKVRKSQIKYLISVGLVGSFFPAFLFAIAQTGLPSSITGVLNALTPLFTIIVGYLIYSKRQPPRVFIGVLLGFVGSAVLVTAGADGGFSGFNFFALFVVLATLFYAFNLNLIKQHLQTLNSKTITSISLCMVGPITLIHLVFFSDYPEKLMYVEGTMLATSYILILGVVGTAIALIIFNKLVNMTDPVFTSSVTYIIPLVAVAWGVLDGELLSLFHYVGIVTILVGVYIANSLKK